nr:hypothetical protein [Tanacetum cinerariifolium]
MRKQESKVDLEKSLDVGLVVTESSDTKSGKQDTSSMPGNDADADNADLTPIYDKEPMAEVQLTAECNVFTTGQQHAEQPEFNNKGMVYQDVAQCQVTSSLLNPSLDNKTIEFLNQQHGQVLKDKSYEAKIEHDIFYREEARKKTQERVRNSNTSVIPSTRLQSTANGSKPKPKSNNPTSRSLPVETTGKIFKSIGLRWIPIGKLFDSCTSRVDYEPLHGSNVDTSKIHKCKQTLDLSAGTSINLQKEQSVDLSAGTSYNVNKENLRVCFDLAPQCPTMALEHDSLSLDPQSQANVPLEDDVSKSLAVSTADASDKRQQQNTTPSTSTTVVANMSPLIISTPTEPIFQAPTQEPTVTASKNINQANI